MKLVNKILVVTAVASVMTACKPDLLDTNPYDKVGSGAMWGNETMCDMGVNGIYATLREAKVAHEMFTQDAMGFAGQARDPQDLLNGTITAGNSLFSDTWKQLYEGIHRANDAIAHLPEAPLDDAKKDRLIAESKFLRAYYYFRLNRVFQGVPVYLEPVEDSECTNGRETADKVWEVIISDLNDCINSANLPNKYAKGDANYGRATKGAAYALLGQTYMWMKDYAKAEAALRKVGDVGFASTSLAVALGLPVMAVSIPIVVIAACLIMFWSQRSKTGGDTAIGMVATGALSIGVIITAMSSGFNVDVNGYMFGSILAMSREDVIFSVVLSIVILVLFVVFYNRLFLITFDENFAKASGIRVGFYQFLIALLTALTVVMGMRMMGSLLISSLIIFPAVIARKLVVSFKTVAVLSVFLSVICFLAGLILSFEMNLPTGASIVIINLIVLIAVTILNKLRGR